MIVFKVIILGDAGSGKTCLMNNYLGKPFNESDPATIGVEFGSKMVPMEKILIEEKTKEDYYQVCHKYSSDTDQVIKTSIWGTSGQERFHSIVKGYYRNVHGVIFVCDLTRKETFHHLKYWIEDFKNNSNCKLEEVACAIVANKTDLKNLIVVQESEIAELAAEYEMPYFLVSSKTDNEKIQETFIHLAQNMFLKFLDSPDPHFEKIKSIEIAKKPSRFEKFYKSFCFLL